jgi:omega-hydroxy-beta-dihydromenaquinone-9 sulfotransferase
MVSVSGPFFVGGTGRCRTSQLTRVLGEHPQVHALQWESRFLVDPGGFEDLARALTAACTPTTPTTRSAAWPGMSSMRWCRRWVTGPGAHGTPGARRRSTGGWWPAAFPAGLTGILREFIQRLFGGAASRAGKRTWCEKTPFNLLSVPFLLELFPEAAVVGIMRHPVHVAASHLDQPWAPSTLDGVLGWLEPVYRRWLAQRPGLLNDRRYVEVKAETLAASWPDTRRELFGRLGLPDAGAASTFAASRLAIWRAQLSDTSTPRSSAGWDGPQENSATRPGPDPPGRGIDMRPHGLPDRHRPYRAHIPEHVR